MKRVGLKIAAPLTLTCVLSATFAGMPVMAAATDTPLFTAPSLTPSSPSAIPGLSGPSPSTTPNPPSQVPTVTGRITDIRIAGNTNVSAPAILAAISQKIGQPFDANVVEADRQAIYGMGYFTVVSVKVEPGTASGDVIETYNVVENPKINSIAFSGNTAFTSANLLAVISTKQGEVLNTNKLDQDVQAIIGLYKDKGYRASISEDINIDPTSGVLTIPIVEARITAVQVTGNKKTKAIVITREMKQKPGTLYNQNTFSEDLRRIFNTGLFDNVGPADIATPTVGSVVLTVPVQEHRTGNVSVGVGYSSTEKLVGRAELSESNFRGLGETVSVMWEVGGTQSTTSTDLNFSDPWIDSHHTGVSVDLYDKVIYRFTNSFLSDATVGSNGQYLERHKGGLISLSRPVDDLSTISLTGRTETVSSNDVALPLAETFIRQNADVQGLGVRYARNTRDNNLNPAAGGFYSVSVEGVSATASTVGNAPSPVRPGRILSPKLGLDLRQYISLQGPRAPGKINEQKRVLALRVLGGFTAQNTPFSEQYFLGGADSLRGYQEDRFWGANLLLVNAEVRIPIGNSLTGVVFTDAGDAWNSLYQGTDLKQHTNFQLQQSVGVGLRVQTPIGPIRLDYGTGREGSRADFSIGQSF